MRAVFMLALLTLPAGCVSKPDTGTLNRDCTWFQDLDGDGWGGPDSSREAPCDEAPSGWVLESADCDDGEPTVHPGAAEVCDGMDNDCDGFEDDDDLDVELGDAPWWYPDGDADGFGNDARSIQACAQPPGLLEDGGDCDDADGAVNPLAPERCNGVDDDCDGVIDEPDAVDAPSWHVDDDADGYGDPHHTVRACTEPPVATDDASDCDDTRSDVHPGADEYCDGVDNDCDGETDEPDAVDARSWYTDADADGYGDPWSTTAACAAPIGHVGDATDCDDTRGDVFPGADEFCDGSDNDCDSTVDEDDALDAPTWHADADADGYGDPSTSAPSCAAPSGWVQPAAATDCDDGDGDVNPAATEICDGIDNDCDALVDDDDPDLDSNTGTPWFTDADSDGYGDGSTVGAVACLQPSGMVADAQDCDDGDGGVNPAATEICDGIDNDCDGFSDDSDAGLDTSTGTAWFADADADGFGDGTSTTVSCQPPSGYVDLSMATDCDDGDGGVNPAATEICDGIDNDCDALVDDDDPDLDSATRLSWYDDDDGDSAGDSAAVTLACSAPPGTVGDDGDCDDNDAAIHPWASEVCDGIDNDCDALVDDDDPDVVGSGTWYADDDLDGYGSPDDWTYACEEPSGYVNDDSDCDDGDANVNPDASESCDGEDDDCDGYVDDGAGCPCSAETYDGHGYLFCTTARTWDYADRLYQGYGYLLATVNDASEQAWLAGRIAAYSSSKSWWIGANDKSSEGNWSWDSGESWSYSCWGSGQPDNGSSSEDCGNMTPWGSGLWNDEQCWTSLYAVYEAH